VVSCGLKSLSAVCCEAAAPEKPLSKGMSERGDLVTVAVSGDFGWEIATMQ
jgi:hypothetical protein